MKLPDTLGVLVIYILVVLALWLIERGVYLI